MSTDLPVKLPDGLRATRNPASTAVESGESATARVSLSYTGLPRQSKQYLDNVLQAWAKWHADTYKTQRAGAEAFESGQYEYTPAALAVSDIIVLVDKPGVQTDARAAQDFNIQYESAFEVPKYDRSFDSLLQPVRFDKVGEPIAFSSERPDKRCHNCGSYAHMIQSCPHEKDPLQIRQRREERGGGGRSSRPNTVRYYQDPAVTANGALPDGDESFADLKPGQLSQETREALGVGALEPPPWLDKMRQLGYPPMYKHSKRKEEELFIFDDQTGSKPNKAAAAPSQAAAVSQEAEEQLQQGQQMVQFPGVNAPIPHGADPALWGEPLPEQPSAAGSKRAQPDYPTQHDIATQPPLKRIRAGNIPSQPFAFNFQQPEQPGSASTRQQRDFNFQQPEQPGSATARQQRENGGSLQQQRQPFILSAGMQAPLHRHDSASHRLQGLQHSSGHDLAANRADGLQHSDRQNSGQSRVQQREPYQASQQRWPPPAEQPPPAPPDPPEPPRDFASSHFASLPSNQPYSYTQAGQAVNAYSSQQGLPSSSTQQYPTLGAAAQSYPGSHAFASHSHLGGFASNSYPPPFPEIHPLYAAHAAMHAHLTNQQAHLGAMHAATSMMSAPYSASYPYQYQQAQSATSLSAAATEAPPPPPLYPPSVYQY